MALWALVENEVGERFVLGLDPTAEGTVRARRAADRREPADRRDRHRRGRLHLPGAAVVNALDAAARPLRPGRDRRARRRRGPRRGGADPPASDGGANSIAWLVWHLTRVQDDHVADVAGAEQVWTAQGWVTRFGLPFAADATGYGQGGDDVAAVRADADLLLGYYDAVHEQTLQYLGRDRRGRPGPDRRPALGSPGHAGRPPGQRRGRRHPARRAGGVRPGGRREPTGEQTYRRCLDRMDRAAACRVCARICALATPARGVGRSHSHLCWVFDDHADFRAAAVEFLADGLCAWPPRALHRRWRPVREVGRPAHLAPLARAARRGPGADPRARRAPRDLSLERQAH